ncbi:MAG: peptidoglycan DD-metalloendopeptidase family protein [Hydrogenophaga sp.]
MQDIVLNLRLLALAAGQSLRRHPRRVMTGIGALLLGTGVTAFGIAPLAPDAADLPVFTVQEPLSLAPLVPDDLPPDTPLTLYRSDSVRQDDTAQSLLQRLGVRDREALAFLRSDPLARLLFMGRAGKLVSVETDGAQQMRRLQVRWAPEDSDHFNRLVIERSGQGMQSRLESAALTPSLRLAGGEIRTSLFAATDAASLPDSVAMQLAEIFSSEIDFRRDLRRGDRFSVVYENLQADGETLRSGRVLSAQFVNNGRTHEVVWFQAPGEKGAYYGFDGQSKRRHFLGSPLAFTRVSSGYGMRFHPVLGQQRAHLGVDYAAPTGTPVRAVGDGVISFSGVQRGYGNVVEITHRNQQTTLYAHLSRIDVRKGQRVGQGDLIGAVGSTGVSTGPHLHFEFRDRGVHLDPLTIARQSEVVPVSPAQRPRFQALAQAQRQQLDAAALLQQASAQ